MVLTIRVARWVCVSIFDYRVCPVVVIALDKETNIYFSELVY